jgi:hypothetical protein
MNHPSPPADFFHFVVVNLVSGVAIGIGFAGIMLVSDTCGIRSLIQGEPNWLLPAAVFVGGSITSFTALVFSTAIFLSADGKSGSAPPW